MQENKSRLAKREEERLKSKLKLASRNQRHFKQISTPHNQQGRTVVIMDKMMMMISTTWLRGMPTKEEFAKREAQKPLVMILNNMMLILMNIKIHPPQK